MNDYLIMIILPSATIIYETVVSISAHWQSSAHPGTMIHLPNQGKTPLNKARAITCFGDSTGAVSERR